MAVSAALAYTNKVTAPIITEAQEKAAEEARSEVLKEADSFEKLELDDIPERVTEVYKAQNGAGYVFMLTTKGYGGDMKLICGIKSDGSIEACKIYFHNDDNGL